MYRSQQKVDRNADEDGRDVKRGKEEGRKGSGRKVIRGKRGEGKEKKGRDVKREVVKNVKRSYKH